MHCLTCHYELTYLTEHRCPECGRVFDPNDPATFGAEAAKQTARWWSLGLVLVAVASCAISYGVGISEGGAGWAYNIPCLLANGLLMPVVLLAAAVLATMRLSRTRGRDVIAWIVLLIAAVTGITAVGMLLYAIEAVATV